MVAKVLGTLLDEVMKHDEAKGGVFSVPVPRDEFPEYYEQIKQPMDYRTMKEKLDKGEYRSAQSMQKDFVLVMQNCLKFNAPDSEIVQEARQQALMKPNLLRSAATKSGLFLAEDGSVLEVLDDDAKKKSKDSGDGTPKKRRRRTKGGDAEGDAESTPIPRKRRGKNKSAEATEVDDGELQLDDEEEDDVPLTSLRKKKPRIKISLNEGNASGKKTRKKPAKRGRQSTDGDGGKDDSENDAVVEEKPIPIPRKKRRRSGNNPEPTPKRKGRKKGSKQSVAESQESKKVGVDSDAEVQPNSDDEDPVEEKTEVKGGEIEASKRSSPSPVLGSDGEKDEDSGGLVFLDVSLWKTEREALDDSFQSARAQF
jgi:hypothetical protein